MTVPSERTLMSSGPICDKLLRKASIALSTFLSTSFSNMDEILLIDDDFSLAIRVYVKSKPSQSTSRGATDPGDRMLSMERLLMSACRLSLE